MGTLMRYTYSGIGYANPDAVTQIANGLSTTTYGYDAFGQRMLQTGTSATYLYPFKWYFVASSTGTGAHCGAAFKVIGARNALPPFTRTVKQHLNYEGLLRKASF